MAAGLGFKTFTTGEVLTAADTNGYLMQGILVFASSAARTAAITSPQEGQYSYLKDTNALEYYDGAAWVGAPVGDITAVTAGTGISGGGTSGDVTITNSMATAIDAKGDLIVGTGADAFSRLAVGTNGKSLVSDSAEATGTKWGYPSAIGCSLWKSANQTANNVTQTPVSFNNEDFDTSGFHDNVTNNDRVTIPTGLSGKYLVTSKVDFSANATGQRVLYHFINGVLVNLAISPVNSSTNGSSFELSGVYNLSAGNFIQMQIYQDSGSALNILGAAQYYTNMQVMYLGA